jgi:hypothetical protein
MMPMVQKILELKSELKDDIERVKSSLLVTISESIGSELPDVCYYIRKYRTGINKR